MFNDSVKTIKITVTVKNRAVIFPDNFDLNALCKEFHTEIILSETDFANKAVFQALAKETEIEFLPADSRLLVNISLNKSLSEELRPHVKNEKIPGVGGGFVEIFLCQPQRLKLRGTKKAQLLDCEIRIPALMKNGKEEIAKSINYAYTLISQAFEPWRKSHTANVFQRVYWCESEQKLMQPLDKRREQLEKQPPNTSESKS